MRRRWLFALAIVASLSGCNSRPPSEVAASGPTDFQVYVIDRGWHTDIGLPVAELDDRLAPLDSVFRGATYLTFGFGDRAYMLDRDPGVSAMARALFPDQAALLVTGLKDPPAEAFGDANVVALGVSKAGLDAIEDFLSGYFEVDAQGRPLRLADGPDPGSLLFASAATYDAFNTCNSWVAEGLHAGGFPVSTSLVVFASQVMAEARGLAQSQAVRR